MAVLKKSTPNKAEVAIIPDGSDGTLPYIKKDTIEVADGAPLHINEDEAGELAVDVFQSEDEIVVVAPVAGVKRDDISININDDVLTLQGRRTFFFKTEPSEYVTQECFWGSFIRRIILPENINKAKVTASFKNCILTITIPKVEHVKMRTIKIKEE